MKKEGALFTLSLIGFAVFYQLSCHTFPSITKEIYRFIWLFCLTFCVALYRNKGNGKKGSKEDKGDVGVLAQKEGDK